MLDFEPECFRQKSLSVRWEGPEGGFTVGGQLRGPKLELPRAAVSILQSCSGDNPNQSSSFLLGRFSKRQSRRLEISKHVGEVKDTNSAFQTLAYMHRRLGVGLSIGHFTPAGIRTWQGT